MSPSLLLKILKISSSTLRSNSVSKLPSFLKELLEESTSLVISRDLSNAWIPSFRNLFNGLSKFNISLIIVKNIF